MNYKLRIMNFELFKYENKIYIYTAVVVTNRTVNVCTNKLQP